MLTKRSDRLVEIANELNWTPNIWMGVSIENEKYSSRLNDLNKVPAKTRFLSVEPLLGPVNNLVLKNINWVIVGGESGHGARPIKYEWIETVRKNCEKNSVPFFFKQWGKAKFNINPNDPTIEKDHKDHAKGGCQLDGKIYRQLPPINQTMQN